MVWWQWTLSSPLIQIPIPGTHQLPAPLPRPSHGSPPLLENEECAQRLIWCSATQSLGETNIFSFIASRVGSIPPSPVPKVGSRLGTFLLLGIWVVTADWDTEECCDVLHACISTYLDIYRYTRYTFWHGHRCCCRQLCGKWAGGLNDPVHHPPHRPLGCMTPVRK